MTLASSLIRLPFTIARTAAGATWEVASFAVRTVQGAQRDGRDGAPASPPAREERVPVPPAGSGAETPAEAAARAMAHRPDPPAPSPEPVASELEPDELVASFAEPGAQDGAGAELHVEEPWPGYREMRAPDIVDRLKVADAATLAAVQLYETTHRARRTVLEQAARIGRALQPS